MIESTIQLREKGVLTLPAALRKRYKLEPGDVFSLVDLGDGNIMLTPRVSRVAALGDRVAEMMQEADVSVDDVLLCLEEEREAYYRDHFATTE